MHHRKYYFSSEKARILFAEMRKNTLIGCERGDFSIKIFIRNKHADNSSISKMTHETQLIGTKEKLFDPTKTVSRYG